MAGLGLLVWPWARMAGIGGVFAGLAFTLAAAQVARIEAPDYAAAGRHAHWVVGEVVQIKDNATNPRRATLVLARPEFYQLKGMGRVRFANIGVNRGQLDGVAVGKHVAVQAILLPPDGPERRSGYDGRLWRFFNGERVYGYVQGAVTVTYAPPRTVGWWERQRQRLDAARQLVLAASQGYADGVVAALLVNSEGQVPRGLRQAYRDSGLSHLLAVSGTQITLVAGGVFIALRWLMVALWPGLALRINTKAWAGIGALGAAAGYTLLAGAGVTVIRAFVMASVVIAAVVLGRVGNLLRVWCVAVVAMVLVDPAVVARVGFQLSIAAVLGLILLSLVEDKPRHWWGWGRELVLGSLVAGAATAPLLVAHFGQLPLLTVVANAVAAVPMMLATYLGFAGLVALPLGWQAVPWAGAGLLAGWVNAWAVWLAGVWFSTVAVEPGWWPVVGVLGAMLMAGVLARRWGWAVVAMGGFMVLSLLPRPLPAVVVWDGGRTAWALDESAYRLLWSDNPAWVARQCAALGAPCDTAGYVPETAEPRFLPVTPLERYAWAEKTAAGWHVEPLRCGRVWQKAGC